jgi:hypothetical protein
MNNLFDQNLIDRINLAKVEKDGKNKGRINLKLKDLQENISVIDQRKHSIVDEKTYQKYIEFLKVLVETTVEQIMAPTVDDFIIFINRLSPDHREIEKLRKFFVDNYAESNLGNSIDTILEKQDSLNIEQSIFSSLIKAIEKSLKLKCDEFLSKPAEFKNKIDAFLEELEDTLSGINELTELLYSDVQQLFSQEQINNNIEFYLDIVHLVIEKNQSLKELDETEKNLGLIDKIKRRISGINKGITLLDQTNVANSADKTFQNLFLKFTEDMVKYEGGVENNLEEFIDNKWIDLETKYNTISEFFENKQTICYNPKWDSYPNKDDLQSIILQYNSLIKENILDIILSKSVLGIQQNLTSKSKAINDFESYSDTVRSNILLVFKSSLSEYESKNLALLDSLAISKPSINSIIIDIKESLEGLKNGIKSLEKVTDLISYLNEDFLIDLNTNNDITALFRKALNESGMSEHLNWLESKLNGADNGIVSSQDFGNSTLIKELHDKGLIKIEIQKTF